MGELQPPEPLQASQKQRRNKTAHQPNPDHKGEELGPSNLPLRTPRGRQPSPSYIARPPVWYGDGLVCAPGLRWSFVSVHAVVGLCTGPRWRFVSVHAVES